MGGYFKADGGYADVDEAFLASGVLAASAVGAAVPCGDRGTVRLTLEVTAVSGTPSLAVTVETSEDGADGSWRTLGTFAAITAVGKERKVFPGCDRMVRANEVLSGGTPSITRTIRGEFC